MLNHCLKLFILGFGILPALCWSASLSVDLYDADFRRATDVWLPGRDWRRLKAQCYQESLLEADAVSPVGAIGVCQFMPRTWAEVSAQASIHDSAWVPSASIYGAAYYKARLLRIWSAPRPAHDRVQLAEASYNAGAGHLIAAQRACGGPALYADIVACLPQITGDHARETITYVERIEAWYRRLLMLR